MTSARKIAANRENARKSTGPRTERGKSQVRWNALGHGLAQKMLPASPVPARIERIARAIAGEGAPSLQYEQALIIAESHVMLLRVRAARVAVVERARERARAMVSAPSRLLPGFPTDHEWAQAFDDIACGRLREASKLFIQGAETVRAFTAKMTASDQNNENKTEHAGADQRRRELESKDNILQPMYPDPSPTMAPDEADAWRRALPELIRLHRYEQRAFSRRARAIRRFVAISVLRAGRALDDEPNEETDEDQSARAVDRYGQRN